MNQFRTQTSEYLRKLNKLEWLLLAVIVLSIIFRFYQLGQIPVSTYWDETAMMVDLKAVLATGQDMHGLPWYQTIYPSYGDYKLPVYTWLSLFPSWLLGVSPTALRLVSAVAGVATIVITAGIGRRLADLGQFSVKIKRLLPLSTALVVATSPWSFMFSRTAFEGHVSQVLMAGAVWVLLSLPGKWWRPILAGGLGALSIYTYYATRFVWFPVAILGGLLLVSLSKRQELRKLVLQLLLAITLSVVLLIPLLKSPWYQPMQQFRLSANSILNYQDYALKSNQLREMSGNSFLSRFVYHRHILMAQEFVANLSQNLSPQTLFLEGDSNLRHSTTRHGLFLWPMILPLILGLSVLSRRGRILGFLLGWWLVALIPASVPMDTPHALRSLNALVPISIIIGFGVTRIMLAFESKICWQKWLAWIWVALMIMTTLSFIWYYWQIYPRDSAYAWQDGLPQIAERAYVGNDLPIWSLISDDRSYLYAMAYGKFRGQDFQNWTESNFQKQGTYRYFFSLVDKNRFAAIARLSSVAVILLDSEEARLNVFEDLNIVEFECQKVASRSQPPSEYQVCQVKVP